MVCVRIISETMAQLPLMVYRRLPNGGKERAPEHNLYRILHDQANREMSSFILRETMTAHLLTWGNAYAEIEFDNANRIVGLWPMLPDRTWPYRNPIDGRIYYRTRIKKDPMSVAIDDTVTIQLPAERVLHIKGLGFDGLKGYSPIQFAREQIGQDLALDEFTGRFFGNGAMPGGVLQAPGKLTEEQYKRLKTSWQEQHQGLTNAQRIAILEEGWEWKATQIPLKDAQWIEARQFSRNMITSLFRIPPHMVGDVERSTSWGKGIEQQAIGFLVYTIQPWVLRWEQEMFLRLFSAAEQKTYFPEFLVDGLVRGDVETRTAAYVAGWGKWLHTDEIRDRENLNPLTEVQKKDMLVPLNMAPLAQIEAGAVGPKALGAGPNAKGKINPKALPEPEDARPAGASSRLPDVVFRGQLAEAFRHVFGEALERCLRRERTDVTQGLRKREKASAAEQAGFVRQFYAEHRLYVERALTAPVMSYAEGLVSLTGRELRRELRPSADFWRLVKDYSGEAAERFASAALASLAEAGPDEILSSFEARERELDADARREAQRAGAAIAAMLRREMGQKMPRVVVIRHGATSYNEEPQRYRGWADVPLTDEGDKAGDKLAKVIASNFPLDHIYSSDLQRAKVTADKIGEATGASVEATGLLRPWDLGKLSGEPVGDGSALEEYGRDPDKKIPGGESLNDFLERYRSFVDPLLTRLQNTGGTVGVVTHTRNIRALLDAVGEGNGDPPALTEGKDPVDTAAYTVLCFDGDRWMQDMDGRMADGLGYETPLPDARPTPNAA